MYVKGPDNALLNLSNAGSARARGSWQVGQLLKAMVVSVDKQGTPTLEINGRQVTAQAQGNLPLRPGQMLQLEVVENGKMPQLKVLNPPANPQELMSRGVRESLPQQQSLTQVLNTLQQLAQQAKGDTGQQLRTLSRQLLEQLPQPQQLRSGAGVKQAVEDSGTFLESKLRQLLRDDGGQQASAQLGRDLKAGLLRLLQAVRNLQQGGNEAQTRGTTANTSQGSAQTAAQAAANARLPTGATAGGQAQPTATGPAQPQTASPASQAQQNTGQESLRQSAGQSQSAAQTASQAAQRGDAAGAANRSAPPSPGPAVQAASHEAGAQLAVGKGGMDANQQLESGLARIQFNQLHSIQQSDAQYKPNWLLEIPIRQAEGRVDTLQLSIQRDREGDGEEKRAIWTVSLSFDLKELGPVRANLTLVGEKQVGVNLWTDNATTAELFNQQLDRLRAGMVEAGLYVNRVGVQQGIPKMPSTTQPFADNGLVDVQA